MKKASFLFVIMFIAVLFAGCNIDFSGYEYSVYDDHVEITRCNVGKDKIIIPSEYKGKPITRIGKHAFSFRLPARMITIPDSITEIGDEAFSDCDHLVSINIPDSVISIGDQAFSMCQSLKEFSISKSVFHIGANVFNHNVNLANICLAPDNQSFTLEDGILYNKDKTDLIFYPAGKTEDTFAIPPSVKSIGEGAFCGRDNIKMIVLPEGLTQIKESAFQDCTNLNDIPIPDSVIYIGDYAFQNTAWLKNQTQKFVMINNRFLIDYNGSEDVLVIPNEILSVSINKLRSDLEYIDILSIPKSVTYISSGVLNLSLQQFKVESENPVFSSKDTVLYNNDKTKLVRYPSGSSNNSFTVIDSVEIIGENAFENCKMKKITLPAGLMHIQKNAFRSCYNLTDVNLPQGVTDIGSGAFFNCLVLKSLALPNSVTTIEESAFSTCIEMKSINVPDSVISIGRDVFLDCKKLTIYGTDKSSIQKYSQQQGIPFKKQS